MGQNTVRSLRVLELLKETDEKHPITAGEIVKQLQSKWEITAERKAVGRDIEDLVYCGYDITLSYDNKLGWYMKHKFDDWELKVLMDAAQSAKFLSQTDTDNIVEKLRALASEDSRRTLKLMTVHADAKRGDTTTVDAISRVLSAMRAHEKVRFNYVYTDDNRRTVPKHPGGTKPVSPYALIWRKDKYYLIGTYNGETLSYYRFDRIRDLVPAGERAVPLRDILGDNAEQKLKSFIKKNVYNKKGEEIRLELQLCSNGIDTVIDSFGDDVRVINNNDGTISAYVTVSDSEGLYTWLMHHAGECSVVSPLRVRNEMKSRLQQMLANYS